MRLMAALTGRAPTGTTVNSGAVLLRWLPNALPHASMEGTPGYSKIRFIDPRNKRNKLPVSHNAMLPGWPNELVESIPMNKFAAVLVLFTPCCATSAVADSSSAGFTVKLTYTVKASPAEVYGRFIHDIGEWWNPQHTFSGDAHNLSIEEKPMGCFCEKLPNRGAVRHMEVLTLTPGRTLVLSGALGPLESLAAIGTLNLQFSAVDGGTKLDVTYAVGGYLAAGMNTWASPVDSVLQDQVTRLKDFVERQTGH
jgi:uncharacterized protein YndB with AHSA1/START domain